MTPQERDVLLPLLDRLRQTRVPVKDAEADQMIRQAVQAQPDAPYILAQTVLMQDYALHAAESRIRALEQQLEQARQQAPQGQHGGFLSGLLGGGRQAPPAPLPQGGSGAGYPQNYAPPPPPYGGTSYGPPSYGTQIASAVQPGLGGGSSFLRSAAQTAAGVAGGMLLAQGVEDLFGGHHGGGERGFAGDALGGLGGLGAGASGFPGGPGSVDQFVDQGGGQGAAYDQAPAAGEQTGFLDSSGDAGYADAGDAGYADDGGNSAGDSFDDGGFADDGLSG